MSVRHKIMVACATMILVLIPSMVSATPAQALGTYRGTVDCVDKKVVGIWIDQGTGSGWADYQYVAGNYRVNWYFTGLKSSGWRLHVGCGGTQSSWQYNLKTPFMSQSGGDFICLWSKGYCWAS